MEDRTICYISDKGGDTVSDFQNDGGVHQPPGLFIAGTADAAVPPFSTHDGFIAAQVLGATSELAVEWGVGHQNTSSLIPYAFIDQAMRVRYPANELPSTAPSTPLLLTTNISKAWLGQSTPLDGSPPFDTSAHYVDIGTPYVAQLASYAQDRPSVSWLPTQTMAEVYQAQNTVIKPLSVYLNGTRAPGEGLDIGVSMGTQSYDSISLYHNEDLIAVFSGGTGSRDLIYYPSTIGLQTFVAIAQYTVNGTTTTATNFYNVGVTSIPEPASSTGLLLMLAMIARRNPKRN
jgi:hypothetical protein